MELYIIIKLLKIFVVLNRYHWNLLSLETKIFIRYELYIEKGNKDHNQSD